MQAWVTRRCGARHHLQLDDVRVFLGSAVVVEGADFPSTFQATPFRGEGFDEAPHGLILACRIFQQTPVRLGDLADHAFRFGQMILHKRQELPQIRVFRRPAC